MKLTLLISITLLVIVNSQTCLDPNGNPVYWWVKLLYPGSVPGGYAYIDSTFAAPSFILHQEDPDSENTPLYRTFKQINDMNLQAVAWNDQFPNGKTSSSKAHSKGLLIYNAETMQGFFVCHSIPQYPSFNGFTINITIDSS